MQSMNSLDWDKFLDKRYNFNDNDINYYFK